jgi:membrane-associated phospholipid phosphatase
VPTTQERIWITWLATVLLVTAVAGGGGDTAHAPAWVAVACGSLLAANVALLLSVRAFSPSRLRLLRTLLALAGMLLSFSALGRLLPAVHPGAFEWRWLGLERQLFGADPTVVVQALLSPALTEVLQWTYAAFYLLPITAALLVLAGRGPAAYDRAMAQLVFAFLLSYLGYLLWPTLPPYRFLDHGAPLQGVFAVAWWNATLAAAEGNQWDCFPSGHTMLSLVSLMLVWRHGRRWLLPFGAVVALLIAATVLLRYHWLTDVVAGALLAWPALRLSDFLLDLDAAEPA